MSFNRHQHAGDDRTGTDPSGKKDIAGVKGSGDQRYSEFDYAREAIELKVENIS